MPAELHSILKIEVPVIVQIASRRMPVEDVLKLSPGAIIELPKLADEELEILVANKQIGLGNAVKVGENFGVRVMYVGDVRQRIAALGAEIAEEEHATDPLGEENSAAIAERLMPEQQQGAAPA